MYVITASGLFLYEPQPHSLKLILSDDLRELAGGPAFVKKSPVNIICISDYSRMKSIPKDAKEVLTAANTGFIAQNVYLFCAAHNLGAVVRYGIDRPQLARAMKLQDEQKVVMAQSVGYRKS